MLAVAVVVHILVTVDLVVLAVAATAQAVQMALL
jgi:hypothetical protein